MQLIKNIFFIFFCFFILPCFAQIEATVGLIQNDSLAYNGYTLFAPTGSNKTYLIDNCGYLINSWTSDQKPGLSVYLLENGNLLRSKRVSGVFNAGGAGGGLELLNWEGELLWEYQYASETVHQHHDIEPLSNGNVLLLAWKKHEAAEAIQRGLLSENADPDGLWTTHIVEIQPVFGSNAAVVVWEWDLWDHMIQDKDPALLNFGTVSEHPELVNINFPSFKQNDWIHANAIDYNPELDQIMLSSRNLSEFWVIDHSTTTAEAASHEGGNSGKGGDLLYRWGNPQSYDRGTAEEQQLFLQHHVSWVPAGSPDEGKIMVFNNGLGRPEGSYSTVDLITPPIDLQGNYTIEPSAPFGPSALHWSYVADSPEDFFSARLSSANRMPNGNTVIAEGNTGNFFEIDPDENIVWQYINPIRNGDTPITQGMPPFQNDVFRIERYGAAYPAFEGKDLSPGAPLELDPLDYECTIYENLTSLTEEFPQTANIFIKTNPIHDHLSIENPIMEPYSVEIFNFVGQIVFKTTSNERALSINSSRWQNGMYVIRCSTKNRRTMLTYKVVKL